MCLSASLTWDMFTPRHLLLPLAFITFIMAQPKVKTVIFLSTYISTYIHNHTNIRMDVANHIVDAHSYAPVLSYGDGEASFIHEVLITPLNLESPCVAILCRQQNITRPQCSDICLSCFALVVATFILGNSLVCFKQSHLV